MDEAMIRLSIVFEIETSLAAEVEGSTYLVLPEAESLIKELIPATWIRS